MAYSLGTLASIARSYDEPAETLPAYVENMVDSIIETAADLQAGRTQHLERLIVRHREDAQAHPHWTLTLITEATRIAKERQVSRVEISHLAAALLRTEPLLEVWASKRKQLQALSISATDDAYTGPLVERGPFVATSRNRPPTVGHDDAYDD